MAFLSELFGNPFPKHPHQQWLEMSSQFLLRTVHTKLQLWNKYLTNQLWHIFGTKGAQDLLMWLCRATKYYPFFLHLGFMCDMLDTDVGPKTEKKCFYAASSRFCNILLLRRWPIHSYITNPLLLLGLLAPRQLKIVTK